MLEKPNTKAKKVPFPVGNYNINVLDFEANKKEQSFVNMMFRFRMISITNKPKKVTNPIASVIG